MRDLALTAAFAPILIYQALRVRRSILLLPEAKGARHGVCGKGARLRLLVLGDSAAAGVGVDHQEFALAGHLKRTLSRKFQLHWHVIAKTGATVGSTLKYLQKQAPQTYDAVVISLGVNNVLRGTSSKIFRSQLRALFAELQTRHGARQLLFGAIPRLGTFQVLPQPLRYYLGRRATRLNRVLAEELARCPGCEMLELDAARSFDDGLLAHDGFHPGKQLYREWAAGAAACILKA